jgi:hypothetical protein
MAIDKLVESQLELIATRREEAAEAERLAGIAGDNARTLRRTAASLLVNAELSPLSVEERKNEAQKQFNAALALATDGTPMDAESQQAIDQLSELAQNDLQASLAFYGSSSEYAARFETVQKALLSVASQQESIEQQQLNTMNSILAELESMNAANGNQPLYVSAGNGQYVSTGAGGYAAGLDLGYNPDRQLQIVDLYRAAGLTFRGAGEGQIGQDRSGNALLDELLRQSGFANGGAFSNGNIIPFRKGGVVGGTTFFDIGAMGEAGPEAIMPLERGADGRLGVVVHGGGAGGGDALAAVAEGLSRVEGRLAAIEANTGKQARIADREAARPKAAGGSR